MLYMVTFTINIPQMLAYIPAPWILWVISYVWIHPELGCSPKCQFLMRTFFENTT